MRLTGTGMRYVERIERLSDRINHRRRRRRRVPEDEEPAGPRLVKGRGYRRRRRFAPTAVATVSTLVFLAAATYIVLRYVLPAFT